MTNKKIQLFFRFLLFSFPFALASTNNINQCPYSKCTSIYNPIHFPFRTPDQPIICGLSGFNLGCHHSDNHPLFSLPSGQNFTVESILYDSRWIEISDPQGRLPEKLMHFDSSGTPFHPLGFTNFTLYNCSSSARVSYDPNNYSTYSKIDCISGGSYSVVCDRYKSSSLSNCGCELVGDVRVAGDWPSPYRFSNAKTVYLNWDLPGDCSICLYRDEVCIQDPSDLSKFTCSDGLLGSRSKAGGKRNIVWDVVAIIIPIASILICSSLMAICGNNHEEEPPHWYESDTNTSRNGRDPAPAAIHQASTPVGLELVPLNNAYPIPAVNDEDYRYRIGEASDDDHSNSTLNDDDDPQSYYNMYGQPNVGALEQHTLETYPTMVIGGSGRMLAHIEDKMCPICLAAYEPNDTLRMLPECLHRFHADCVDVWLRTKATCPVCRILVS